MAVSNLSAHFYKAYGDDPTTRKAFEKTGVSKLAVVPASPMSASGEESQSG